MPETLTREARSAVEKAVTKQDVLQVIPQYEIGSLFKRHHLNREVLIGTVGLRGDGKSGTDAVISLVDFMLEGKPVWSNLDIAADIAIDDQMASKYGLNSGGVASFRSEPLDKEALLKLDGRYSKGCLHIEEINIQYANTRRAMANTNIDFNAVCQQLRHDETSLVYNVIDEMFVDSQLRTMTDIFIKCEDTAYSVDGLERKQIPGKVIKWTLFPMSGYLVGRENSYYRTKKPMPPVFFRLEGFWGIYDDKVSQRKGVYSTSLKTKTGELKAEITAKSSPLLEEYYARWGWLAQAAQELKKSGIDKLPYYELWKRLKPLLHGETEESVKPELYKWGIIICGQDHGHNIYKVEDFELYPMSERLLSEAPP